MMQNLSRRIFLKSTLSLLAFNKGFAKPFVQKNKKLNVIYIMADDLGWADLGCYGREEYRTPHLDGLARKGTRFTHAYSASPVCTPTRCAFTTGRYPARTAVGLKEPLSWRKNVGDTVGLEPSVPTIASLLKQNGYHTILIGKWHLGYLPKYSPIKSGFDDFFGIMSGGVDYFTHRDRPGELDLYEDEVTVDKAGYITDLITDRAVEFISGKHEKPFFLSLNYTAPHWPWEGPDDVEKSKILQNWVDEGGSIGVYGNMMASLDEGIGKVLSALRRKRLEKNTLVIFTSDNGGERFSDNGPFSGQKFQLLEGGLRVPAIVYWKDVVPKNKVISQPAVTMDWTATILALTETPEHPDYPLDGDNLLPVVLGEKSEYERTLYWRVKHQNAVRSGKWKYYAKGTDEYLFNIEEDEKEQTDLKEVHPEIFANLKEAFNRWDEQMLPY